MATNWNTIGVFFFGFSKLNCLFGFSSRKVSHRSGIHRWLRLWQSCRLLRWTTGKIFQWTFEIFNYSSSSTAATKWNIAPIKILLLFFYLVCLFGLRSSSPRDRRCPGFESHLDEYATAWEITVPVCMRIELRIISVKQLFWKKIWIVN